MIMKNKRTRAIFQVVCFMGAYLLLSTAGASDYNTISLGRAMAQSIGGLVMFGVGAYLGGLMR